MVLLSETYTVAEPVSITRSSQKMPLFDDQLVGGWVCMRKEKTVEPFLHNY